MQLRVVPGQRDKINPPSTKPWVTVKRQRSQTTRTRTQLARQSQRNSQEAPPVRGHADHLEMMCTSIGRVSSDVHLHQRCG